MLTPFQYITVVVFGWYITICPINAPVLQYSNSFGVRLSSVFVIAAVPSWLGRAPTSEGQKGRDHDHYGFTVWMAGGGVKGGGG